MIKGPHYKLNFGGSWAVTIKMILTFKAVEKENYTGGFYHTTGEQQEERRRGVTSKNNKPNKILMELDFNARCAFRASFRLFSKVCQKIKIAQDM